MLELRGTEECFRVVNIVYNHIEVCSGSSMSRKRSPFGAVEDESCYCWSNEAQERSKDVIGTKCMDLSSVSGVLSELCANNVFYDAMLHCGSSYARSLQHNRLLTVSLGDHPLVL